MSLEIRSWARCARGLALALAAMSFGCGSRDEAAERKLSAASQPPGELTIDALRDMPYAGEAEIDEDATSGVVARDRTRMQPGYTLYSLHLRARAHLIDEVGNVHKVWEDPGGRHWDNVELLPNGDILTTGADPHPAQGIRDEARYVMRLNWKGEVLWKKYMLSHHDITTTPSGELMLLTFARREAPEIHPTIELRDDEITRLTPDGEFVASLSLYETIAKTPERYPYDEVRPTTMGGRSWVDLFHCNSLEWINRPDLAGRHPIFGPSNVLFCSRHQNRIAVVDMEKKEIVWSWGRDELDGPHDATVLENGNIMVFDNGLGRGWSRVIELDPVTEKIVWEYVRQEDVGRGPEASGKYFYTKSKGSNQRLPNGNTLICNSDNGELIEVTYDDHLVVWHYLSEEEQQRNRRVRPAFVRAYRYDRSFIDGLFEMHGEPIPPPP